MVERGKKLIDLTGMKFGKLLVLERSANDKRGYPQWLCRCDCGRTKVILGNSLRRGITKSCSCYQKEHMKNRKGSSHPSWRGGRSEDYNGYIRIHDRDNPNANKSGYVFEHVLVMSHFLGRPLYKNESVHHKNGIRSDNRLDNLELVTVTGHHFFGQRVEDMVIFCEDYLATHAPHLLIKNT